MPRGQFDQFLHQLVVLAVEVHLVEDLAHAADGPQLLDEGQRFVVALLDERGGEVELLLLVADLARHDHLGRARLLVTPHDDQLIAGKQIARLVRINAADGRAFFRLRTAVSKS